MNLRSFRNTPHLIACCIAVQWASTASAAEPSCDLSCPRGYVCELVESCVEILGGECELAPTCRPLPCSADSDCDQYMKCYKEAGPETPGLCLPVWHGDCGTDADCGPGFTCAEWEPCLDPSERADAGGTCQPEGPRVCYIHTFPCQEDGDCLAGWTCENNPRSAHVSGTDGQEWCIVSEPALICMPPHGRQFPSAAGFLDWQTGVEWATRRVPVSECPSPRPLKPNYTVNGGGIDEPANGDTSVGSAGAAAAPAQSTSPPAAAPPLTSAASYGCSLGLPGSTRSASAPWSLLALGALGALIGRARRRRT